MAMLVGAALSLIEVSATTRTHRCVSLWEVRVVALTLHAALSLLEVQPEGKGPMDGEAFVRGARLDPDCHLGAA